MSQVYKSGISIKSGQVPSAQSNFPVLVSQTDARFKTIGNGGHVNNSSGFDIRPYSDSDLVNALSYTLERYNASTGEVVMWVKVASLSSSTTPIYLGYGDTTLNSDGSSSATWSNGFLGVYNLKDGTTLSVASSTGSNNGTNNGVTATSGKIDGGGSFVSASNQYIDCGTGMAPTSITLSAWVNATSFPNVRHSVIARSAASSFALLTVSPAGKMVCLLFTTGAGQIGYNGSGTNTLSTGTTYYLALTYDEVTGTFTGYFNGSSDATGVGIINDPLVTASASTFIGEDATNTGRRWNGMIDEARVASVARSANWITTEYNNQSSPSTFETLEAEQSAIPISGLYRL